MVDLLPFWLTLKLALFTTAILLAVSIPLAYWLAQKRSFFSTIVQVVAGMPLVLPPSVIGFYLLLAFSPAHGFGQFLEHFFSIRLVFSFEGLVIGSVIYSLPFMVYPIQAGLAALPTTLKEASFSLGKNKWQTLTKVLLPNIKPALLSAVVLTLAHTIGEFGVVLMIGGNIPGKTNVASIAVYDAVESMDYQNANIYALILLITSFVILLALYFFNYRLRRVKAYG
jgi:molybdate transport system permease protein